MDGLGTPVNMRARVRAVPWYGSKMDHGKRDMIVDVHAFIWTGGDARAIVADSRRIPRDVALAEMTIVDDDAAICDYTDADIYCVRLAGHEGQHGGYDINAE